jgi:ADP-heptose:LPS heptosyltransferase
MRVVYLKAPWRDYDYGKIAVDNKSVCVVRYGAFGDMIQTSSILAALKEQGYHITLNAGTYGFDVVRNDPNIDCIFVQETDLVPNNELPEYWKELSKHFNKFVNLSESIERSLLAVETEKAWNWHHAFRDMVMNVDYLDATHAIAEVSDYPKKPKFYPNKHEIKWAKEYRRQLGLKNKVIMWALSGSSVHKAYPHTDTVIARLLLNEPRVRIVMVGDQLCRLLDSAWENEPRVKTKSGKWPIRDTLAFMQQCDVIVGPETGVMNAASFEPMKKVIMLSHSSPNNLGTSWANTSVMTPKDTDCYPCHKMHYGWATCNRDKKTGGAMCAANISPDDVYNEIVSAL